jgi:hypothetical protein
MSDSLDSMSDAVCEEEPADLTNRTPRGIVWGEYEHLSDLYRFYLDLILKTILTFFVIATTVITLVLANRAEQPSIDWALGALAGFSGVLAVGAAKSSKLVVELKERVDELAEQLGVGLAPHVQLLRGATLGLALLAAVTFVLLAVLLVVLRLA